MWIQCHNLPLACMNPETIRMIGERVGKVEEVDMGDGGNCVGQYARIRVTRDIERPLQRCVRITSDDGAESQTVLIRYERLLEFCQCCGIIGHTVIHCDDTEVDKARRPFGPWLKAVRNVDNRRGRGISMQEEVGRGNFKPRPGSGATGDVIRDKEGRRTVRVPEGRQQVNDEEVDKNLDVPFHDQTETTAKNEAPEKNKETMEGEKATQVNISDMALGEDGHDTVNESVVTPRGKELMVIITQSPSKKKKRGVMKGWKRMAREASRVGGSNALDAMEEEHSITGVKRGGNVPDKDARSPKRQYVRSEELIMSTVESTADAVHQPRRSP